MPEFHIYEALDRPDVEVLWGGTWCPGEARMRTTHSDGRAIYDVQYRRPGEISSHLDTFAAADVRLDTIDRSRGRGTSLASPPGRP